MTQNKDEGRGVERDERGERGKREGRNSQGSVRWYQDVCWVLFVKTQKMN